MRHSLFLGLVYEKEKTAILFILDKNDGTDFRYVNDRGRKIVQKKTSQLYEV